MILSFKDKGTADIFEGRDTGPARRTLPRELHGVAGERLDRLNAAMTLSYLALPGFRLHRLKGDRRGQHSIRVNARFRVCLRWTSQGAEDVEIVDYH
jgi:proteic killer suppression protein